MEDALEGICKEEEAKRDRSDIKTSTRLSAYPKTVRIKPEKRRPSLGGSKIDPMDVSSESEGSLMNQTIEEDLSLSLPTLPSQRSVNLRPTSLTPREGPPVSFSSRRGDQTMQSEKGKTRSTLPSPESSQGSEKRRLHAPILTAPARQESQGSTVTDVWKRKERNDPWRARTRAGQRAAKSVSFASDATETKQGTHASLHAGNNTATMESPRSFSMDASMRTENSAVAESDMEAARKAQKRREKQLQRQRSAAEAASRK